MDSGSAPTGYVAERLDHLGIVAGVCQEIGLAEWLDAQDTHSHEQVSVGTATVAMFLNGLGFSNRRLYLVPQFFATKAVERLLGPGITAADLNDDCLGRALDWLYAHDPITLFAGIALRARRAFGISAWQVHVDTTSFSVLVKKPERIVALSLVMVLCLLIYRLAEHRLREQLAVTGQTIPSQVNKPTDRPIMRWVFQCFEGVDLLHIRHGPSPAPAVDLVLRVESVHQQVLALLGPAYEQFYKSTN